MKDIKFENKGKKDLRGIGWENVNCINVFKDREYLLTFLSMK
jgi:hypothetical protein